MFKSKGKIILIIILIIQLLIPFGMLIYQGALNKKVNETPENVRLKINSISIYEENVCISVDVNSIHPLTVGEDKYLVFDELTDEYSDYYTSKEKPNHERYITFSNIYDLGDIATPLPKDYAHFSDSYWSIYDRENEASNIAHKRCEGPETEAYVDIAVHNGNFVLKNASIGGLSLEDYLKAINNGEINLNRYEFNYFDEDFNLGDYYDNLDEDTKEMVDELAGQILEQ